MVLVYNDEEDMKAEETIMPNGITVKQGQGGNRLEIQCIHQRGLLYVVPSEASWVCAQEQMHAHSLAGFFGELLELQDPRVKGLMQRWGLYFRELSHREERDDP